MTKPENGTGGHEPRYGRLIRDRPALFRNEADGSGVRVATDPAECAAIAARMAELYRARGWPAEWAEVGVGYADPYLMMLRDAVVFPDGSPGLHHRIVSYADEPSGVAILALHAGRIVLVRHFRHPLRRWMLEVPRGAREPGESAAAAARRELDEEIGGSAGPLREIGRLCGASGNAAMTVQLLFAELETIGAPRVAEGIEDVQTFTVEAFEALLDAGEILDAFTLGCFHHARRLGLV